MAAAGMTPEQLEVLWYDRDALYRLSRTVHEQPSIDAVRRWRRTEALECKSPDLLQRARTWLPPRPRK